MEQEESTEKVKCKCLKKLDKLFRFEAINKISVLLYNFCGTYQLLALIIVIIFFVTFLALVIIKDFCGSTDFVFNLLGYKIEIGQNKYTTAINIASFFVDFATLPLVVVTLMFTAHGAFGDSQLLGVINAIKDDVDQFETQTTERDIKSPDGESSVSQEKSDAAVPDSEEIKKDIHIDEDEDDSESEFGDKTID